MCFSGVNVTVSGTICFPSLWRERSRRGCLALRRFISPFSEMIGIPATKSRDVWALAIRKSSSPMHLAPFSKSGTDGLIQSLKSYNIFAISLVSAKWSSFISFVISTISAGSMNVVFPDEDSSYTKPCIFLLLAELTGMSILPSRITMAASLSTSPSLWALRRIMFMRLETAPSFSFSCLRMS